MFEFITDLFDRRPKDNPFGFDVRGFGIVTPHVYRSACPSDEVLAEMIDTLRLATVLDLRAEIATRTPPRPIEMRFGRLVDRAQVVDVPRIEECARLLQAADATVRPILVYCAGGRHRTGAVVATYRVRFQSWSAEDAYEEALAFDLYSRWGHQAYVDYIKNL